MTGGWVKLQRALLAHPVHDDRDALLVWVELLLRANHEPTEQIIGKRTVKIGRGQIYCSHAEIGAWCKLTRKQTRRIIAFLTEHKFLGQPKGQPEGQLKGQPKIVITLCNYDEPRKSEKQKGQLKGQPEGQLKGQPIFAKNPQTLEPLRVDPFIGLHSEEEENKEVKEVSTRTKTRPKRDGPPPSGEGEVVRKFISHYAEAYKATFGQNPEIGPKGAGIAKRIVREVGLPKAIPAVDVYLADMDPWLRKFGHDLKTLELQLARFVGLAKERGLCA